MAARAVISGMRAMAPAAPALLLLSIVYVVPVMVFLATSFIDGSGGLSLAQYRKIIDSPAYFSILMGTVRLALVTTLVCVAIGYPVAYFLARAEHGSRLLLLILMPFWISYLVRTFAWLVLLGRTGVINSFLMRLGIVGKPLDLLYNFSAVVTGMVHAMLPLAVLTMYSTMQNIPGSLLQASATLGARPAEGFFRVYLPMSIPGVAAAGLMIFIICLGFFVNPALLGSRKEMVITQVIIDQLTTSLDWGFASAVAALLLVVTLAIVLVYQQLFGMSTLTGQGRGASRGRATDAIGRFSAVGLGHVGRFAARVGRAREAIRARLIPNSKGGPGYLLLCIVFIVIVFLIAPVLFLIPVSFSKASFLGWPPDLWTTRWYRTYLLEPIWLSAITRSLIVATLTAVAACAFGIPAAFSIVRGRYPGKNAIMSFITIPMILPHMIPAIALFAIYAKLGLVGSIVGLVIAHTVLAIPLVVITVSSVLRNYDQRLDQAAAMLGARPLRAFRTVTLPLIASGVTSGFLFSFLTSFEELTVALFVTGGLTATLPKQMWEDAINQVSPGLAAVSTVILLVLSLLMLAGLMRRRGGSTAIELRG